MADYFTYVSFVVAFTEEQSEYAIALDVANTKKSDEDEDGHVQQSGSAMLTSI